MIRNKNEVLITRKNPNDQNEYRINLHYIELTLPRFLLNPLDQIRIENIWKTKPIQLIYNRFEVAEYTIPKDSLTWTSPNLFDGYTSPVIFFVFVQSQARAVGDYRQIQKNENLRYQNKILFFFSVFMFSFILTSYSKSIHKFEMAGTLIDEDNEETLNLKSMRY